MQHWSYHIMALLNKLFFPTPSTSSMSTTASTSAPASTLRKVSSTQGKTLDQEHSRNPEIISSGVTATASRWAQNNHQPVHSKNYLSQFPFDGRQVRVLLYRECDKTGRKLLFDSNALQKVPLKETNGNVDRSGSGRFTRLSEYTTNNRNRNGNTSSGKSQAYKTHSINSFIEVCEEYGYKHIQPNPAEFTSIGEMVFGASAISFRGTAFKVHWLQQPPRILCSQVFLSPVHPSNGHSPYSTISTNSLATPRTSISSEHGSIDGFSLSSFSMLGYSMNSGRQLSLTPSDRSSFMTTPLDVPDQQTSSTASDGGRAESGLRFSSTYSNATDSGYDGMSRSQMSSDQWSASYQYSTRSSLGSVMSEQMDLLQKFSIESAYFAHAGSFDDDTSDGSLQRRISRNLRTSFENEHAINDLIGFISDNYPATTTANCGGSEGGSMGVPNYRRASYSANESRSNPEIGRRRDTLSSGGGKALQRRAKLGLAVCITMSESFEEEMELFCSEHIALLESMLGRLRACTERAYINHKEFYQIMFQAWLETQQWFSDLFTAPRIKCPIWLSITTSGNKYSKSVAEKFMKELCWLLSFADTKDTNFFISTMLTAILTHHLGWVSTISAFNSTTSLAESSTAAIEQRAKLLQVSQKHPYNALWAQMGDLYGAIGLPPRLTRTIIYGTEKLAVERLLNILTYFIRCGEVRRSAKREDFSKESINSLVQQRKNEVLKKSSSGAFLKKAAFGSNMTIDSISGSGLKRTKTCKVNLNTITDSGELSDDVVGEEEKSSDEEEMDGAQVVRTLKKNEIPNVLAFRDSRFVQQELRIGNYLMDTGIEKKSLVQFAKSNNINNKSSVEKGGRIRVLVTTPDNEEMPIEDESSLGGGSTSEEGAVEAIEIDSDSERNLTYAYAGAVYSGKRHFFWQVVKEGLSLSQLQREEKLNDETDERECGQLQRQPDVDGAISNLSLSDLITQNSMGKSDRMTWGIEPRRENVSLEEQIHFDNCQRKHEHGSGGVVFMLGENEPLVNLKRSNEDLTTVADKQAAKIENADDSSTQQLCPLHQRTHGPTSKRHSGVKFNFEQFPQIATNYMKSKNLVLSNYDLLMDKSAKFEAQNGVPTLESLTSESSASASTANASTTTISSTECMVCNSILNSYQTPSNATELEFETDEIRSPYSPQSVSKIIKGTTAPDVSTSSRTLQSVSSAASIDTLKSSSALNFTEVDACERIAVTSPSPPPRQKTYNANMRKACSHRGSISSVAAKCAALNEAIHLLKLPVPAIKEIPQEDEPSTGDGMKLRAGFVPSLFLSVSDHYVSDMVLQGTCAPPDKWQTSLREDLALSARAASLISLPAENVAIVANMEKWDVRLISSQLQHFPYAGEQSTPVGMSQLVSSMLETVHAMNSAGIPAYECLAFLESKMQEIYLQSESLAAFLLETEFCQLSTVTTALNLSENDVPLLLSIASVHTPQIAKKCGISFR
ncbi:folliculin-interacting protein 1 isoform X1 [Anastrepha obliqua]|uniref:folliculin-interacting protein 1 isoform X1 n=1 Tax=Anastrepha obliqua TaxID=95512 RepID=UPI0024097C9A|nr:folliculin-interacting protein 1 isoform X1 [Anastrepha obliqua]XP_054734209.1 folliculin-interacting protein 1 isoform X1 [Anastrepha obliqua]XP_054734211.1 folliculin-interacting protein 1 isoform X1 [Anastrepha obliqua]XP_054734212.1 folliculin-interacting protein 1 isoform X1 [Anastrepha obliqua]